MADKIIVIAVDLHAVAVLFESRKQCDQMLELKVAKIPKVAQKISKAAFTSKQ